MIFALIGISKCVADRAVMGSVVNLGLVEFGAVIVAG